MKCPRCQNEVQPDWRICGFCGLPLQIQPPVAPPVSQPPQSMYYPPVNPGPQSGGNTGRTIAFVIGGIGVLSMIVLGIILMINNFQNNSTSSSGGETFNFPTRTPRSIFSPTDTPFVVFSSTNADLPTLSLLPTATLHGSCPGAKDQRLTVNKKASVCTRQDRLILRVSPSLDADEIIRIYPGTMVKVIGGPKCSDNSSWWQIEVPTGTTVYYVHQNLDKTLTQPVQGWVREGSDDKDPYFLCPMN
jgi:hypothetical protein